MSIHTADLRAVIEDMDASARSGLVNLVAGWLRDHEQLDRADFVRLVDEARAVTA